MNADNFTLREPCAYNKRRNSRHQARGGQKIQAVFNPAFLIPCLPLNTSLTECWNMQHYGPVRFGHLRDGIHSLKWAFRVSAKK
jgi:hypothetical protein